LACGISKAGFLADEAPRLEHWLNQNYNGEMAYMANHFDMRLDPTKLVDGAKSVVTVLLNYFPEETQHDGAAPKVSKYAYGQDYHHVIKGKLRQLTEFIQQEIGEINGRAFVDSAPVMDKAWAIRSGLGWMGKHTNIIRPKEGSFFFIGELILDIELEPDAPMQDHCGSCTRCIDACPTEAIIQPYVVDGSKCISYFTIELKDSIPMAMKGTFKNWAFGCDICQDVCPWNRFAKPHTEPAFNPHPDMLGMTAHDWHELTEEVFMKVFQKSAVKRAKFSGLKRNLDFLRPTD
jgi:epoxyqueuosine reductase